MRCVMFKTFKSEGRGSYHIILYLFNLTLKVMNPEILCVPWVREVFQSPLRSQLLLVTESLNFAQTFEYILI